MAELNVPTQVIYRDDRPVLVLRAGALRVAAGPEAGRRCDIGLRRVQVGTALDNDLVLSDPSVSRHHLEVQVQDQGYLLVDLGSTNGTFFRGGRVDRVRLAPGSEVRLGETTLVLEAGAELSRAVESRESFGGLIGRSEAMQQLYGLLEAVAPTDTTVLIEGETGTGKELVAEEIHRRSPRRHHPFMVIDCTTLPAGLIESELFGHQRGAFSGADAARVGLLERARGGTVFFDEIGELPLEAQARLLRVLDRRTVRPVGSNVDRPVDLRVIAATNRKLDEEVSKGRFRRTLYFRLAVIKVRLTPLRERREDIPSLAGHFLWQLGWADPGAVLPPNLLAVLQSRAWPGNVRELRNMVERAVASSSAGMGAVAALGLDEQPAARRRAPKPGWLHRALPEALLTRPYKEVKEDLTTQLEAIYLGRLRQQHGTNISRIAQAAGIDRHLVRDLLRKHGLDGGQ